MTKGGTISAMNRFSVYLVMGVVAISLVAALALWANKTNAGSDRYTFLIRGYVTKVDTVNNTVRVSATHTSPAATADLGGVPTDYNVKGAKFYKWTNGVKKRVSFTKSAVVGDEVVIRGAAKTNGNYNAAWLVVNEKDFEIVGKLRGNDLNKKQLTVLVGTSTYKQTQFANKEVVVQYSNSTKFKAAGKDIDNDDVSANNQTVKVKGQIQSGNWIVTNVWDNYK